MISRHSLFTRSLLSISRLMISNRSLVEEDSELISVQNDYFLSSSDEEQERSANELSEGYHTAHLMKTANEVLEQRHSKLMEAQYGEDSLRRLVKRPERGFLWGLGAQLYHQNQNIFEKGKLPTIRQLIRFLSVHQAKDITVFNLRSLGWNNHSDYSIVCTGYSPRHLHKMGRQLLEEIKKLELKDLYYTPTIAGRKEDEWLLLRIKDVSVNILTEDYRAEMNIEQRYLDDPTEEEIEQHKETQRERKRSLPRK